MSQKGSWPKKGKTEKKKKLRARKENKTLRSESSELDKAQGLITKKKTRKAIFRLEKEIT